MTSQIRKFISGDTNVQPSYALDVLVWLNFEGYKSIRKGGVPPESLIVRDAVPTVSLERFLSKNVEYLFREDISIMKVEELYLRFTNRMEFEDAQIVYKATEGKLEIDPDFAREYAGDRRFPGNGAYIFRDDYIVEAPVKEDPSEKDKKKDDGKQDSSVLDGLGDLSPTEEDGDDDSSGDDKSKTGESEKDANQESSEKTAEEPVKPRRGGRRRKVDQQPATQK